MPELFIKLLRYSVIFSLLCKRIYVSNYQLFIILIWFQIMNGTNIGQNNSFKQPPLPPTHRKRQNILAIIGLGLILLSVCTFVVSPEFSVYAWLFALIISIAGLFFKPRWMAVVGTIISVIPILFMLLLVLVINNPGPPSPDDLRRSQHLAIDNDTIEPVDSIDSLLLAPVDFNEISTTDSLR